MSEPLFEELAKMVSQIQKKMQILWKESNMRRIC